MSLIISNFLIDETNQIDLSLSNQDIRLGKFTLAYTETSGGIAFVQQGLFYLTDQFSQYLTNWAPGEYSSINRTFTQDNFQSSTGSKVRKTDISEALFFDMYDMDQNWVYYDVTYRLPFMAPEVDGPEGFMDLDISQAPSLRKENSGTDQKDFYLDFDFVDFYGEHLPWEVVEQGEEPNLYQTYDVNGNPATFTYSEVFMGDQSYLFQLYLLQSTIKIKVKNDFARDVHIKLTNYYKRTDYWTIVVNQNRLSSQLARTKNSTKVRHYFLGTSSQDGETHETGYYCKLLPGEEVTKEIYVNATKSNLQNVYISEIACLSDKTTQSFILECDNNYEKSFFTTLNGTTETSINAKLQNQNCNVVKLKNVSVYDLFNGEVSKIEAGETWRVTLFIQDQETGDLLGDPILAIKFVNTKPIEDRDFSDSILIDGSDSIYGYNSSAKTNPNADLYQILDIPDNLNIEEIEVTGYVENWLLNTSTNQWVQTNINLNVEYQKITSPVSGYNRYRFTYNLQQPLYLAPFTDSNIIFSANNTSVQIPVKCKAKYYYYYNYNQTQLSGVYVPYLNYQAQPRSFVEQSFVQQILDNAVFSDGLTVSMGKVELFSNTTYRMTFSLKWLGNNTKNVVKHTANFLVNDESYYEIIIEQGINPLFEQDFGFLTSSAKCYNNNYAQYHINEITQGYLLFFVSDDIDYDSIWFYVVNAGADTRGLRKGSKDDTLLGFYKLYIEDDWGGIPSLGSTKNIYMTNRDSGVSLKDPNIQIKSDTFSSQSATFNQATSTIRADYGIIPYYTIKTQGGEIVQENIPAKIVSIFNYDTKIDLTGLQSSTYEPQILTLGIADFTGQDANADFRESGEIILPAKPRTGDDFYFVQKVHNVSANAQTVSIDFFWNGLEPARMLSVKTATGIELNKISLPTELSLDGFYTMQVQLDNNISGNTKEYYIEIISNGGYVLSDNVRIYQEKLILPELTWDQSVYSIEFNERYVELGFTYKGENAPNVDLQLTCDDMTIQKPDLPLVKTADGHYTMSVVLEENKLYDKKIIYFGLAIKEYSSVSYTECRIEQGAKKHTVLSFAPAQFNVNNEVSVVSTTLTFNDWHGGIPANELYVSNNLGLVDYELPATYSESNTYKLNITVPANQTEEVREYYFTVKTKDQAYQATVNFTQKASKITKLYFVQDSMSIDAVDDSIVVQFYWNGPSSPRNNLEIQTSWGETIVLPNTITQDGFYNIRLKPGVNTSYDARDLTVDIVYPGTELETSLYIYQRGAIRPDTVFYFDQTNYIIDFNQETVDAVLHYNDFNKGIPANNLLIESSSTFQDFTLPDELSDDGIYQVQFKIGPNIELYDKSYKVILIDQESGIQQNLTLKIGARQLPQLYWLQEDVQIAKDQEDIAVSYYWTNFAGGDPSHYLMMSSDIPGFEAYLPWKVNPTNIYTFNIHLGENKELAPRNYTVLVRTADRIYGSTMTITQLGTGGSADFTYRFEKQEVTISGDGVQTGQYISNKLQGPTTSLSGQFEILNKPYWIPENAIRFDKNTGLLTIDQADINVFTERSGKIQILFYGEDLKAHAAEFTVKQSAGVLDQTNIIPIWRDTFVDIDAEFNYFRLSNKETNEIYFNGQTIDGEQGQIKLNNIISDYLSVFGDLGRNLQNNAKITTKPVQISVSCSTNGSNFNYTLPETFKFLWDYSYDNNIPGVIFNGNVIDYFDPRQRLMVCSSNRSLNELVMKTETIFGNSTKSTVDSYTLLPGEMRGVTVYGLSGPGGGVSKVKVTCQSAGSESVKEYNAKCTKANYCLHYVNRYGQINWMLFGGKQMQTDKITGSKYIQSFDNNFKYNYENVVYQNKIEESWSLTTDYLTDYQSKMLADLYRSPIVFLEDLGPDSNGELVAVTVETKTVDVKNYRNQGKFFTHTIKVQNSQNRYSLL